jgi:indolepyruvate ferredoxin oxidoreductase alpha subunit
MSAVLQTAAPAAAGREFLSGNEAVARGAWEAGVEIAAAYPGTPSTEILESLSQLPGVYAEWSSNEKVALEVVLGASMTGRRTLTAMKHVGLNVASDSLMTMGLVGVKGGLVVAVSDDIGFSSSQNEQDSRFWGRFVHLPVLEPADAAEALAMTRDAFELSERHQVPVLLRLTTRVSHVRRPVRPGERTAPDTARHGYQRDVARWIITPNHVGKRLELRAQRDAALAQEAARSPWNVLEPGRDRRVGFVASGALYHVAREAYPDAPILKLGFSHPLPLALARQLAAAADQVLVLEESEPIVEQELKAAGLAVHGKDVLPAQGEIGVAALERAVARLLGSEPAPAPAGAKPARVFPRPPTLCAGCPYMGVYFWLGQLKDAVICGDIGCYTLGCGEPWNAMDSIISMGASLGVAHGMAKAFAGDDKAKPVLAVIGDSTFVHGGMAALANITYQGGNVTVLLLDNRSTAMTGGQNNPGNGRRLDGSPAPRLDFARLVEALGVRPERVRTVDPYELPTFFKVLREEMKAPEPSVILATRPCVLTEDFERRRPLVVNDQCNGCARCLEVGCPAITVTRREQQVRATGKVVDLAWVRIERAMCTGCDLCAKACGHGAIVPA